MKSIEVLIEHFFTLWFVIIFFRYQSVNKNKKNYKVKRDYKHEVYKRNIHQTKYETIWKLIV